jgi:hypothetical protein
LTCEQTVCTNFTDCSPVCGSSIDAETKFTCGGNKYCQMIGNNKPPNTPTPTPGSGGGQNPTVTPIPSDSADCPYINTSGPNIGDYNACLSSCSAYPGYIQHSSVGTPGGTNGNALCERVNGKPNACCTKTSTGSTPGGATPTTGAGGSAPISTPTSSAPTPTSKPAYTPPANCVDHPQYSTCGNASQANTNCYYSGGTGYWGTIDRGTAVGCDATGDNWCFVCTP